MYYKLAKLFYIFCRPVLIKKSRDIWCDCVKKIMVKLLRFLILILADIFLLFLRKTFLVKKILIDKESFNIFKKKDLKIRV